MTFMGTGVKFLTTEWKVFVELNLIYLLLYTEI